MKNETYDLFKMLFNIVIPALSSLIITLGNIWGIPYSEEISATIIALSVCGNAILKKQSNIYFEDKEIIEVEDENFE